VTVPDNPGSGGALGGAVGIVVGLIFLAMAACEWRRRVSDWNTTSLTGIVSAKGDANRPK
jgi:hypothetical protein